MSVSPNKPLLSLFTLNQVCCGSFLFFMLFLLYVVLWFHDQDLLPMARMLLVISLCLLQGFHLLYLSALLIDLVIHCGDSSCFVCVKAAAHHSTNYITASFHALQHRFCLFPVTKVRHYRPLRLFDPPKAAACLLNLGFSADQRASLARIILIVHGRILLNPLWPPCLFFDLSAL